MAAQGIRPHNINSNNTRAANKMLVIPANGANTFRWIDVPSGNTYTPGTGLQLSSANQFSISNGGVDTAQIANAAITAAKIETANAITGDRLLGLGNDLKLYWLPASSGTPAANSITTAMIQNNAITADKIASNAVTGSKILNATINRTKLNFTNTGANGQYLTRACLLYTSPSPRDRQKSRMPSSA